MWVSVDVFFKGGRGSLSSLHKDLGVEILYFHLFILFT